VLALGSIVRGLFDRPTIGSTTESFLSNLPCDLLLVHS
jgi:nucleotide-binding universal stress UspA family protein